MFVVSMAMVFAIDFADSGILLWSFYFAVVLLVVTTLSAIAHDLDASVHAPVADYEGDSEPSSDLDTEVTVRRSVVVGSGVLLTVFVIVPVLMLLLSLRAYTFGDSRARINGYLMTHTVTIPAEPHEVFDFITYRMEEHNLSIAKAHERFEIIEGDGLTLDSRFIAEEWDDNEGVLNDYLVREVIPDRLIHMASTPSRILERDEDGNVTETSQANAYVYFDLKPDPAGTELTQTVVIEMPNFVVKSIIDMVVLFEDSNPWQEHLVEELEGLQAAIEEAHA